jgi:hypothetical protein
MTAYNDNSGPAPGLDTAEAILVRRPVFASDIAEPLTVMCGSLRKTRVVYGPV